ncbi:MAG: peptide ABC transporter substrate-binding protein [Clostridia bacterium]|nr:peptide ABC transporter substrate-binding protein [Clostridia bacterium]
MKKAVSLLLVAAVLLVCAGCGRSSGGNIVYPISVSPETLDPQYTNDTGAQLIINNIFEGLVRFDSKGEIIPGIAASWSESEDGLTWTFKLKAGTEWYCSAKIKAEFGDDFYKKFSSEKVTADDFVFACQRTVDPAIASPNSHRMLIIENAPEIIEGKKSPEELGVKAVDDYTLEFKLSEPCPNFTDRLTECEFMPCNREFYAAMKGRYGLTAKHILCNGPFYLTNWDYETTMTCKANKYYAGKQSVTPSSVIFAFENTKEEVLAKLASGSITAALLPPESPLPENVKVDKEIRDTVCGFIFNAADEVLKNENIRKALCSCIDVSLFDLTADNVYAHYGIVPDICASGSVNYREKTAGQTLGIERNEKKALEYWTKGIEKLGTEFLSFTVLCPEWAETSLRKQFQVWQTVFGLNISVKVETRTEEEIAAAVEKGEFQIALGGIQSRYTDAVSFLSDFRTGWVFNWKSAKYAAIIDRLAKADSEDEIVAGCYTAENYILNRGIFFPVYSKASRFVVSENAEGITILDSEKSVSFIKARRTD